MNICAMDRLRISKAYSYVFVILLVICVLAPGIMSAQKRRLNQNPKLNNLVHAEGYKTGNLGDLGRVRKAGNGPKDMILIAGAGFGGNIWDSFVSTRKEKYTMYVITLPGFGGTQAPPMPSNGTSYGVQTWTKSAQTGVHKLIVEKKLKKPIIVAHWIIATQIAIGLALENPDILSRVVIISGVAKNALADAQIGKKLTVKQRISWVDKGLAPRWFKTVTRDTWDDNAFYPSDYAVHPVRALQLWRLAFEPTLPVHIRYLCENWSQDSTVGLSGLKVPLLIVMPNPGADYDAIPGQIGVIKTLTRNSWEGVEKMSKMIRLETVEKSRVFIMDDQPKKLDEVIAKFLLTK